MQTRKRSLGKKLMAAALSAAMLLGSCTCAFAEETAAAAAATTESIKLSNLRITSGEQVIDLAGVNLEVDVTATEDELAAISLHLDVDGETAAVVCFTGTDTLAALHLESPTLGVKDYLIDPAVVMSRYMDEGIQSLIGILQSIDTKAVADSIVQGMNIPAELPAEPETEAVVEPETEAVAAEEELQEVTVEGDIAAVIEECITGPETVELGGVLTGINGEEISVADGTYNKTEFSFGIDTLCKILDMIYVNGEPANLSEELLGEVNALQVSGSVTKGTVDGLNNLADVYVKVDDGTPESGEVHVAANKSFSESGDAVDVAITGVNAGTPFGVSISAAMGTHEGEAFTMDSVDMDSAIMLSDMDEDAAAEELSTSFSTLGIDVMGIALSPVFAALMDTSEMETEVTPAA